MATGQIAESERTVEPSPPSVAFQTEGEDQRQWRVRALEMHEELSGRCWAIVELDHEDAHADPLALRGASTAIRIWRGVDESYERRFCGVVRSVEDFYELAAGDRRLCRVRVEPAFALLDEEISTRPFVDLSVPEILREVLREALGAFGRDFELRLSRPASSDSSPRAFATRELCVQYGESTYDFCRRIMAEEGLTYFFEHSGEREKLVIVDEAQFGGDPLSVPFGQPDGMAVVEESVFAMSGRDHRQPNWVQLKPLDALNPEARWAEARLATHDGADNEPDLGSYRAPEAFDPRAPVTLFGYQDGQHRRSDAPVQAELWRERIRMESAVVQGAGDVLGFAPGRSFALRPLDDRALLDWAEGSFIITGIAHRVRCRDFFSSEDADQPAGYQNEFTCLAPGTRFRPVAIARPMALEDWGIVLGASENDPIDTEQHGRVRIQFLYDRRDPVPAHKRSPWMPVTEWSSGAGFGSIFVPRAGMVVRVEYRHGDPDQPIVADCFETAQNTLPAELPQQKTRSTVRTRSQRDGGKDAQHFNEIALDDAAEAEEVFVRAGRDYRRRVLHDERAEIDHDESRGVGRDQTLKVVGQRRSQVQRGETEHVLGSRHVVIGADDEHSVLDLEDGSGGSEEDEVDGSASLTVKLERETELDGLETTTVRDGRDRVVDGTHSLHVTAVRSTTADELWKAAQGKSSVTLTAGSAGWLADAQIEASTQKGDILLQPDGLATLKVTELKLVCGAARVTIGPEKIAIQAPQVLIRAAGGAVTAGPQGVATTGKEIVSSAVVLNELKGPLVIISDTPGSVDPLAAQDHHVTGEAAKASSLELAQPEVKLVDLSAPLYGRNLVPLAGAKYQIRLPTGEVRSGTTDGSGTLKEKIPAGLKFIDVTYAASPDEEPSAVTLELPGDEGDPAVVHLLNLGFGGPTRPQEEAVRNFQRVAGLPSTGELDAATKKALEDWVRGTPAASNGGVG
jgi:type VI secretion system secreted protein VgrG